MKHILFIAGEKYFSLTMVIEKLQMSRTTIQRWIDKGYLKAYRHSMKNYYIRESELTSFIKKYHFFE
ncbi:MAG TPA: helix-turn-helix domain-containing protein [Candidatus Brocadiaceae bacterium]